MSEIKFEPEAFYSPEQLSKITEIPLQTLSNWRAKKFGPEFCKLGARVLYKGQAVLDYLESTTVITDSEVA